MEEDLRQLEEIMLYFCRKHDKQIVHIQTAAGRSFNGEMIIGKVSLLVKPFNYNGTLKE